MMVSLASRGPKTARNLDRQFAKGKEWIVNLLAPVGRMALTNYLLPLIIVDVVFHFFSVIKLNNAITN